MWKELIDHSLTADERIPILTAVFSDPRETKEIGHLHGVDAEFFLDMIDEVFPFRFI